MDDRPAVVEPVEQGPSTSWRLWAFLVRVVMFAFGVLQVALVLRIVLLLLGADQSNAIVSDILNATKPFVEPFRGIFSINALSTTAGSIVDVAAIVALIGWTIVEAVVVAFLNLFDR